MRNNALEVWAAGRHNAASPIHSPQAGGERFPCHKFIVASGSSYFSQQLAGSGGSGSGSDCGAVTTHRLDGVSAAALRQVLQFLYTGTCDLLRPGPTDFRSEPEAHAATAGQLVRILPVC